MNSIIGLVFCVLLGVMIHLQGWTALLWVPAGFIVGLFVTSNVLLLTMMGLPRAIGMVAKGQMRPGVFGAIIRTPMLWAAFILAGGFSLGWFWPVAAAYLYNNMALNCGICLGTVAIILSPLSKKNRSDFANDFDKAHRHFYTNDFRTENEVVGMSSHHRRVDAAITVTSNLYLHTIPEAEDAPIRLQFTLPDSRYRYLMFCLSAVTRACAPKMKKEDFQSVFNDCLQFLATWATTDAAQKSLGGPVIPGHTGNSLLYLQEFGRDWSKYVELEKEGKNAEMLDLVCSMIHSTESSIPAVKADKQRLEELALCIACQLPIMQDAFVELSS